MRQSELKMLMYRLVLLAILTMVHPVTMGSQTIPPGKLISNHTWKQYEKLAKISPGGNRFLPVERHLKYDSIRQRNGHVLDKNNTLGEWEIIGPSGVFSADGSNFICSGRVRDLEIINNNHVRVASSSGGLWDIIKNPNGETSYTPLSTKEVSSIWSGAVATDPFNHDIILLGTGEPAIRGGAGLWRSADRGVTWNFIPMNGNIGMGAFDEIEFTGIKGKVWCSGSDGVFFSKDSGLTWTQKRGGNFPGMAVYPRRPDTVLVAEYSRGIFRTRNGGSSWQKCVNGLPTDGFYRVELSNCATQPDVIYALFTKNDHTTMGIYKSIDGGDMWTRCTVFNAFGEADVDYHWGMAWYCSFISVSPTNPNHVFSGGGWYIFSEDGQNFYGPTAGQHPDFHCGAWSHDGKTIWTGNDGGVYATAFDKTWRWDVLSNNLPLTQFVTISVSRSNPEVIIGGTQDNGLVYYSPNAGKWFYYFGDGGGAAIDPHDAQTMYGTIGISGPPLTFRNVRKKGPSAGGWQNINDGLRASGQWWRLVRTDYNEPATLYTQVDHELYYSLNQGQFWHHLNVLKLPLLEINSMKISLGEYPKIYVSGPGPDTTSFMRLDLSTWDWTNITKGLPTRYNHPAGLSIPHVFVSENPSFPDRVFAVMRGYGPQLKNNVIFQSDDSGITWQNISGDLPDVPYTVLLENPGTDNILIAGTDGFGIFITRDGGKHWVPWDEGLPKGSFITDIDFQKFSVDSVYAVISTYGNSIWRRLLPNESMVPTTQAGPPHRENLIRSAVYNGDHVEVNFVEMKLAEPVLRCFSMDGACLFEKKLTEEDSRTTQCILSHPASGLYMVQLSDQKSIRGFKKFLIP